MLTFRSEMRGGFRYEYFPVQSSFDDIISISHSLCLAHLGREGSLGERDQPLFCTIVQIYKSVQDDSPYRCFWEHVGMFLRTRTTCRFALSFCSSWYQETVSREVALLVKRRLAMSLTIRTRRRLGCQCAALCELDWLNAGWQCPAARHAEFLLFNHARGEE